MTSNQYSNKIHRKDIETKLYLSEKNANSKDIDQEIAENKTAKERRFQRIPYSMKENDSHRSGRLSSEKDKSKEKQKSKINLNTQAEIGTTGFSNPGALFSEVPASDIQSTPKSSRKSAESMWSASPKSTLHSKLSSLNNSHPPLVRSSNPGGATLTNRNGSKSGSKLPLSRGTPKGNTRTPKSAGTPLSTPSSTTPCGTAQNIEAGSSRSSSTLPKRDNGSRSRMSSEEPAHPRCTPLSTNVPVTPTNSAARKSFGSASKNVRSSQRRSSSARKSSASSHNSYAFPFTNTPLSTKKRLSYQGFWGTPPSSASDLYTLRRADIHNGVLNLEEGELRREDESSTVSVGVRVRPLNDRERKSPNVRNILSMNSNEITVHCENGAIHSFVYDMCFWSCQPTHSNHASQQQVYDTVARPLLVHAYEGYNVCLFAYGQTGSGKSYCIMGEDNCAAGEGNEVSEGIGIIPRFCRELFEEAELIHSKNSDDQEVTCQVVIEISYIEIYNEKIYDLVSWQNPSGEEEQRVLGSTNIPGEKRDPLRIREHPVHGPHVVGASCHLVTSYQDLETWINLGNKQRSIAATGMNDKSSRSHSVFSVKVTQTQVETIEGEEMEHSIASLVNIVDLAGSERVAASHSEGDRLKEGVCINKSLLTLGKVITALAESDGRRKVFIPYRESTLTWLLKESLGGNSKTTMIATVSPCNVHQEETLSTLRYAQQARKIVNWNRINEDPTSKIIRALKLEVERLRSLQVTSPKPFSSSEPRMEEPQPGGGEDKESEQENERLEELKEQRMKEREIIRSKELEISFLKEKLRSTQEQFSERTKLYEDKLQEAEIRKREALERCRMKGLALKLEENEPTLVHLCEDPQLSQTLLYSLKKGSTTLGTSNSDVTLSGLHETDSHCSISYEGDRLVLHPKKDTETYVNGKLVSTPTEIFHNDRVVLAGIYFFRICFPVGSKRQESGIQTAGNKFDFIYARDELLKEQEDRIRKEMSIQQAATRAEMLKELEEQRLQLKLQEMSLYDDVRALSSKLEEERNLNQETEMARQLLEEEKQHLEAQVRALRRFDSLTSIDGGFQSPSPVQTNFFDEMEAIFDESIQIVENKSPEVKAVNVEMWFMVAEANNICTKLKKSYEFRQQSRLTQQGFEITIFVHDSEHGLCASIDTQRMKEILNILRDLATEEQDDDTLLDAAIPWERYEELSSIPFVQNKVRNIRRMSINQSLNSSFLNFTANGGSSASSRRSSFRGGMMTQNSLKPSSLNSNQSALLAKGVSQALLKFVCPSRQNSPFADVLSHLIQFHKTLKEFLTHSQDSSFSEDRLSEQILQLAMLTPSVVSSLNRLGSTKFSDTNEEMTVDLQAKISGSGSKFVRKVARMLQGVENSVESLTEEEGSELTKQIHELVEDVGFLNLIVSYELLQGSSLVFSLPICSRYLVGVSKGLEWKVNRASEWSEKAASVIASPVEESPSPSSSLRNHAVKAVTKTAAFLGQFSQLKVEPNIEETMPLKEAKNEASRFLGRVAAASDNVQALISALASITGEFRALDEENIQIECLNEAVVKLQESLGDLVDDAGVGSSFERRRGKHHHRDSNASDTSVESFLESLHSQAMKAFKSIKALRNAVNGAERAKKLERAKGAKGSPLQCHFEGGVTYPLKSALRSGLRPLEKKVRFNVSLSSSMVGSFLEFDEGDDEEELGGVMDV